MKLEVTLNQQDPPEGIHAATKLLNNPDVTVKFGKLTKAVSDEGSVSTTQNLTIMRILGSMSKSLYHGTPATKTEIDHWLTFSEKKLKPVTPEGLDSLNQSLKHKSYLVGDQLSIADLAVYEKLKSKQVVDEKSLLHDYVNVRRWLSFIEVNIEDYEDFEDLKIRRVKVKDPLATGDGHHVGKQATNGKGGGKDSKKSDKGKSQNADQSNKGNDSKKEQANSNRKDNSNKDGGGGKEKKKDEGKFVELPGAEMGKVVVRFPPEASGFLHIGHAKAALLNQYYQQMFKGKLIMRFDDTNPAKENVEFEEAILEDLAMLQIKPDQYTYTSNYFDLMLGLCEDLIKTGHAYADDTDAETMKIEREKRQQSKNWNNSVEKNLELWSEMKKGSAVGQTCCIRAKIDMNSHNGCMRDPTIYRCKNEVHPRTGDKFKVYPTYDFACPIVDSLEGVTHALRTTEYHDRDDQFYWFIDVLKMRKPFIYSYSRLNLTNTVLSKRRLTWFVDQKLVDGWDDPRFPTVRGVLRRGMTVEGLKQFIVAQGSSRSVVMMEWDKIWAFNRKVIDPVAPRHTALTTADRVLVNIENAADASQEAPAHPKNPEIGTRKVWTSSKILVEKSDAVLFKEGENVTFIHWGNIKIVKITKDAKGEITSIDGVPNLEDKDYKSTLKITWLADTSKSTLTPIIAYHFDHIISKAVLGKDEDFKQHIGQNTRVRVDMIGDEDLQQVKKGDIIQLQRKGFFICDAPFVPRSRHSFKEQPIILNAIPDGHTKEMPTAKVPNKQSNTNQKAPVVGSNGQGDVKVAGSGIEPELRSKVDAQGNKVRQLKEAKATKDAIAAEVKVLHELKAAYKQGTGQEYSAAPPVQQAKTTIPANGNTEADLRSNVDAQGNKVRQLKEAKASKDAITAEVKILQELKAAYKQGTGQEYSATLPVQPAKQSTPAVIGNSETELRSKVDAQGNKVRQLKEAKASKDAVTAEVKILQELKAAYKQGTGQEYTATPAAQVQSTKSVPAATDNTESDLRAKVDSQGNKVRQLKEAKAGKDAVTAEVKILQELKAAYKQATGKDYTATPAGASPTPSQVQSAPVMSGNSETEIRAQVDEQGAKVRQLKEAKASKGDVDAAVKSLLELKAKYKEVTGQDYVPTPSATGGGGARKPQPSKTKEDKKPAPAQPVQPANPNLKKQTRLGLEAKKSENLPDWYSQVITKGEMIEYYDVSGCYILRPWSYSIWEAIHDWFDAEIKKLGVENAYFPMFVSHAALEKEKNHIADFAPEVAWVTRSGDTDLAEPVAIRPTSETVMYPSYAKWVQSYRDLPIKLNQWNNVVRWEFKHPQPFLRTREFLWQEGHTAFATFEEAKEEVMQILGLYERVYTDLLAIPVIPGRKTEKEKFPGGDYTTTVEAFVSASGRGLQGATSHHLGQNFSKMFEIIFEDPETKQKQFAYQNSWGLSTRTIGAMIMIHSDDNGLVLPPRVARYQVVIIPCGLTVNTTDAERNQLLDKCKEFEKGLLDAGIRAKADYRDNYSPGWKFNHWELKGVPIRVEIGPRDLKEGTYVAVSRHNAVKTTFSIKSFVADTTKLLKDIHDSMFEKAKSELDSHITVTEDWKTFCGDLDKKNIIMAPFCGAVECEEHIKKDSSKDEPSDSGAPAMGAKSLCIPFKQPKELQATTKCVHPNCTTKPQFYTLFGRSY